MHASEQGVRCIMKTESLAELYARRLGLSLDELLLLQDAKTQVLTAAARGEIDLNRLARDELIARGLDLNGRWVGFERAARAIDEPHPEM